jgi:hypothetical protein
MRAKQDSKPYSTVLPVSPNWHFNFAPFQHRTTLQSLPTELIAEILSNLIPQERTMYSDVVKNSPKRENANLTHSKSNPLNIMAVNSYFYSIGRQDPMLRHRNFCLRITPEALEFEGHTNRALERLQGTFARVEALSVVFDVGYWGSHLEDGHLNQFLRNYGSFMQVLNEEEIDRYNFIRRVGLQGKVHHRGNERQAIPDCLHGFGDDCANAMLFGRREDFESVMQWFEPRWEVGFEVEADESQQSSVTRSVEGRFVQMADSLRMLAKFCHSG